MPVELRSLRWGAALLASLATLALATSAQAMSTQSFTLDELPASVDQGELRFSNFLFLLPVGEDPADYTVTFEDTSESTSISLTGPMEVTGTDMAEYAWFYDVSVILPITEGEVPLLGIDGVTWLTPSEILDNDFPTFVEASSEMRNTSSTVVASLVNVVFLDNDVQESGQALDPAELALSVRNRAELRSGGQGDFARLDAMTNEFTLVPEPATAATLALGLLALGARRSRPLRR